VLADVLQKPDYSAGSTLKLILPFFKAYGITDSQMEDFSAKNIILIANSKSTLNYMQKISDTFIVSTSYEHYIKALCKAVISHTKTHIAPSKPRQMSHNPARERTPKGDSARNRANAPSRYPIKREDCREFFKPRPSPYPATG
jgi:predicted HAD superfamily phosphohydrolase